MMHERVLIGTSSVELRIEHGLISTFTEHLPNTRVVIITDETVYTVYAKAFPDVPCIVIAEGEASKSLQTFGVIVDKLLALDVDPSVHIVGIGGGVICDITGFVASVYMRGVSFSLVPTTILAQADAAIGGKNGINIGDYKNMLGTITQPKAVYIDPAVCSTLHDEERANGLFEVLKYGCIADAPLLTWCDTHAHELLSGESEATQYAIAQSVIHKVQFVIQDEHDKGIRRALNFGHTFGHALELQYGLRHGYAVGCGIVLAAAFSHVRGLLGHDDFCLIQQIMTRFGMPTIPASCTELAHHIRKDKKRIGDMITLVLIERPGAYTFEAMTYDVFDDACLQTDAFLAAEKADCKECSS